MTTEELLLCHLRLRPALGVQDAYKLIYQSVFGVGHLIDDPGQAQIRLERELAGLYTGPRDPLAELICPAGAMVRVNLRPYRALGLAAEPLLAAMLESVRCTHGLPAEFRARWEAFCASVLRGALPFDAAEVQEFDRCQRQAGWPAMHHSERYRQAHFPAYRVLRRDVFERAFPAFGDSIAFASDSDR